MLLMEPPSAVDVFLEKRSKLDFGGEEGNNSSFQGPRECPLELKRPLSKVFATEAAAGSVASPVLLAQWSPCTYDPPWSVGLLGAFWKSFLP